MPTTNADARVQRWAAQNNVLQIAGRDHAVKRPTLQVVGWSSWLLVEQLAQLRGERGGVVVRGPRVGGEATVVAGEEHGVDTQ
jgi:hypothetical protein